MGKASSSRAAREVPIALRKVVPVIPGSEKDRKELDTDLKRMGCHGLRERPWAFRDEVMVRELIAGRSNEWDNTLRAEPELWTAEVWRDVYGFPARGEGMCSRKEVLVEGKFSRKADPKDGLTVADCLDPRA